MLSGRHARTAAYYLGLALFICAVLALITYVTLNAFTGVSLVPVAFLILAAALGAKVAGEDA